MSHEAHRLQIISSSGLDRIWQWECGGFVRECSTRLGMSLSSRCNVCSWCGSAPLFPFFFFLFPFLFVLVSRHLGAQWYHPLGSQRDPGHRASPNLEEGRPSVLTDGFSPANRGGLAEARVRGPWPLAGGPWSLILDPWTMESVEHREWSVNGVRPGLDTLELHGVSRLRLAPQQPSFRFHPWVAGGRLGHFMLYCPRPLDPHGASLEGRGEICLSVAGFASPRMSKNFRFCRGPESLSSATAETARNSPKQPQPAAAQRRRSHPEGVAWHQMWP